ncbi:NAD+ synthase [Fusobacterium gonidiaformans]|uniref:NAD+ synthase n=1 Tax=Fusobacterium gonidiaformans TaxID=849 RepID=UPI0001BC67C8|nr:NAD+ synthase [Fusobacterium gonidiaformans]AVQ16521.1 NAD+ synthase [Fusobacterium gonidiaformans ATCC 25563]EFS29216.1 NAD+ synthetase [Fusobacterium gonidiaformans ATCC 25563]
MKSLEEKLVKFIQEQVKNAGFKKVILGLSGGIDSALVAYLAVKALGKENVIAIKMPYKTSSQESIDHANLVLQDLDLQEKTVEITPMVDAYFENQTSASSLRRGNYMARTRMTVLFDQSALENALVIGTSNKTEILLGYGTLFGDMACSFNPIGDIYKKDVWSLSRYMGVPKEIIEKQPSADLWAGQTDEQELGLSYKEADEILERLVDKKQSLEEIVAAGYEEGIVNKVIQKVKSSAYKRKLNPIAKVGEVLGRDFSF